MVRGERERGKERTSHPRPLPRLLTNQPFFEKPLCIILKRRHARIATGLEDGLEFLRTVITDDVTDGGVHDEDFPLCDSAATDFRKKALRDDRLERE